MSWGPLRTRDLPVFPLTPDPVRPEVPPSVEAVDHQIEPTGPYLGPRIGLVTLGCDKNTVDSERIMAALVGHGAQVSSEVQGADVVVINTCGFIEAAKEQSVETILEACSLKEAGEVKAVVAVGCLVQRYKEDLAAEIPEVDLFMGLTEMQGLVPELRTRGLLPAEAQAVPNMERPLRILSTDTSHTSYLKVSEGCDHTCAFCAIPHMRGLHRSHPVEELVREARELEARGVKELNIISQDTTWYGRDLQRQVRRVNGGGQGAGRAPLLPDLLDALLVGTDLPWYRLFYMYPSGITEELVALLAASDRILPYLDMPIQHGSDRLLRLMRRPERKETIRERVRWLRDAIPDLTLRTTVIVGFPGETDDDFREMLDLLEEIRFERVGAFTYSLEEDTRAAEMEGHLPNEVKEERLAELMEIQREISFEENEKQVGTRFQALVDQVVDDEPDFAAQARIVTQALDVDGVTHLLAPEGEGADQGTRDLGYVPGDMVEVEIVEALDYDLIGRVVR